MLLGIIEPDAGARSLLGNRQPLEMARVVGYLPEERGLYPAMHARDAIAFMGALRGLPIAEGRRRADALLAEHGLGDWGRKSIRSLSKGMAQLVQLLGTIIHKPRLLFLDEPFAGLDAINQGRLEELIRREARAGVTIVFSTHVIAHAERLCEEIAIIAKGKVVFDGRVDEARSRLRPIVRLRTRASDGPWQSAIPDNARREGSEYVFELPEGGPEPLLKALIDGGAGIETLAIERPGLHDAFVSIAGNAAAAQMGQAAPQ
jgi:ABC-2 type transport system ATP-binding protein